MSMYFFIIKFLFFRLIFHYFFCNFSWKYLNHKMFLTFNIIRTDVVFTNDTTVLLVLFFDISYTNTTENHTSIGKATKMNFDFMAILKGYRENFYFLWYIKLLFAQNCMSHFVEVTVYRSSWSLWKHRQIKARFNKIS